MEVEGDFTMGSKVVDTRDIISCLIYNSPLNRLGNYNKWPRVVVPEFLLGTTTIGRIDEEVWPMIRVSIYSGHPFTMDLTTRNQLKSQL